MEEVLDEGSTARLKLRIEEGAEDENAVVVPQKKECFFITSTCFRSKQGSLPLDIALKIRGVNENLAEQDYDQEKLNKRIAEISGVVAVTKDWGIYDLIFSNQTAAIAATLRKAAEAQVFCISKVIAHQKNCSIPVKFVRYHIKALHAALQTYTAC
ncbi:hypothetical protein WN944_021988 [Citrus x changshan-huyou]|uniref:Uncharacterized protein n=1 Tax=Citrus x changshan-huyou TaxID=2935761 RepID=A0AAP0N0D5_9ROSI